MITINNKIDSNNFVSLIFSLTKSCFFGYGISSILFSSYTSSIISFIIGFIISILISLMFLKVYNYSNNLTILEKLKEKLNPFFYYIIFIIVILYALFMAMLVYYIINYFILSQYLTDTSFFIVLLILVISAIYLVFQNYETLTRFSFLTTFITAVMLIINIVGVSTHFEFNNILPIYNYDIKGILYGSFIFISLFTSPLLLMSFIKRSDITDKENLNKKFIISIIISGLTLIVIITVILGALGITLSTIFSYPEYIVLKKIKFNFIESIENISFLLWVYYAFNLCSCALMFVKYSLKNEFKIKSNKTLNIITLFLMLVIFIIPNFLLNNNPSISSFIYKISPIIYFSVFFVIIFLMFIFSLFNAEK